MACNLRPVLHLCLHHNPCLCKTSSALSDASSSLLFTPQKSRRQVTTWVHQINAQSISHCGVLWGTTVRIFCLWGRIIPKQDFQRSVVWHPRGLRSQHDGKDRQRLQYLTPSAPENCQCDNMQGRYTRWAWRIAG